MAERVKDLELSLQWLRSLLWCRLDPWLRNLHMLQVQPKKKKKEYTLLLVYKITLEEYKTVNLVCLQATIVKRRNFCVCPFLYF